MQFRNAVGLLALIVMTAALPAAAPVSRAQSPDGAQAPATKWNLVWFDEFNGADGSRPDKSKWVFDVGSERWGNNELECYTDRPDNSVIRGGNLVITARKENIKCPAGPDKDYTSARLKTEGLFSQTYGRFEARIKVPRGQGMWPAFWMLGDDITKVGWPASGEIDIMEIIGKDPSTAYGSLHGPGYNGSRGYRGEYRLPGTWNLPTRITCSRSSGNRTWCVFTSTTICTRRKRRSACRPTASGCSITRSSSF